MCGGIELVSGYMVWFYFLILECVYSFSVLTILVVFRMSFLYIYGLLITYNYRFYRNKNLNKTRFLIRVLIYRTTFEKAAIPLSSENTKNI